MISLKGHAQLFHDMERGGVALHESRLYSVQTKLGEAVLNDALRRLCADTHTVIFGVENISDLRGIVRKIYLCKARRAYHFTVFGQCYRPIVKIPCGVAALDIREIVAGVGHRGMRRP